jgi:divalent metal cation (Fe/Co/Zn/Cd) transporter
MNLKKLIATLILGIIVVTQASAKQGPTQSYQTVISHYMDSYMWSDYKKLKDILADDAIFKSNRDVRVVKQGGNAVVDFMKKNGKSEQQNCTMSYEITSETSAIVLAKVNIKYNNLYENNQENFLVLENQGGEWKITQVYKMYLENKGAKKVLAARG